jgi:hypothetical protein
VSLPRGRYSKKSRRISEGRVIQWYNWRRCVEPSFAPWLMLPENDMSYAKKGNKTFSKCKIGRAMAQAVSSRPLTAAARIYAQFNACGICGRRSGTGTGFSLRFFGFSCQSLESCFIWGMNSRPAGIRSSGK